MKKKKKDDRRVTEFRRDTSLQAKAFLLTAQGNTPKTRL